MKLMIASDIHGSKKYCQKLLDAFEASGAKRLILLGDLLYHGPRNPLPDEYAPQEVAELLNAVRTRILAVRGNCDADVDQMMLEFPILNETLSVFDGEYTLFCTHGHVLSPVELPPLQEGDILLTGHTHVPHDFIEEGIRCINPGSVALPKADSAHACLIYEDGVFTPLEL